MAANHTLEIDVQYQTYASGTLDLPPDIPLDAIRDFWVTQTEVHLLLHTGAVHKLPLTTRVDAQRLTGAEITEQATGELLWMQQS